MSSPAETAGLSSAGADAELSREMRGVHAGMFVLGGVVGVSVGNYVFHVVTGRMLGPSAYSDVVSLLALSGLISVPLGGVQLAVARFVAESAAQGDEGTVAAIFRSSALAVGTFSLAVAAAMILLADSIQRWLSIESHTAVVLTAALTIPSLVMPVLYGYAQGLQRFRLLAGSMLVGTLLRIPLAVVFIAAGYEASGALGASLAGGVIAVVIVARLARSPLRRHPGARAPNAAMARYVVPAVLSLLAITSLTTLDVVVAKAALGDTDAGIYGSASLIGRVAFYVPAAIVTVMLPKVSARLALGRDTDDILSLSLAVTLATSLAVTLVYALVPTFVMELAFGGEFVAGEKFLWIFGAAMTFYALLNVLLIYDLAHGATRMVWIMLGGAALQGVGFALFHDSAYELLAVNLVTGAALLAIRERMQPTVVRAAILMFRLPRRMLAARRRARRPAEPDSPELRTPPRG